MNPSELCALVWRLRMAAGGREAEHRALLGEAAEAIETLVAERGEPVVVGDPGLPSLDAPCPECDGSGCRECEGSGVLPSVAGAQILGFLARAGWRRP